MCACVCVCVCVHMDDLEEVVEVFHLLLQTDVDKVHLQRLLKMFVKVGKEAFHQTVNEQNWSIRGQERRDGGRGGGGRRG